MTETAKRKILIISPLPTHPNTAGWTERIYHFVEHLKSLDFEIHFLHLVYWNIENHPETMREYFNGNYYPLQIDPIRPGCKLPFWLHLESLSLFLVRLVVNPKAVGEGIVWLACQALSAAYKLGRCARTLLGENPLLALPAKKNEEERSFFGTLANGLQRFSRCNYFFYYQNIDDKYPEALDLLCQRLREEIQPDIVLVEYVFFSKALECFGSDVVKLIDTHDLFTNRHRMSWKTLQPFNWFSTSSEEEARGLERADIVIAITAEDRTALSRRIQKQVVTIGHAPMLRHAPLERGIGNKILFVGSRNLSNQYAALFFARKVFPLIRKQVPDAEFLLAGSICTVPAIEANKNCVCLGVVENLDEVYRQAAVVVNPDRNGTGLAIKSMEALSYAKPLVTTTRGARGIMEGAQQAFFVADLPEAFARATISLLQDSDLYQRMCRNALEYARIYQQRNLDAFTGLFSGDQNSSKGAKVFSVTSQECALL